MTTIELQKINSIHTTTPNENIQFTFKLTQDILSRVHPKNKEHITIQYYEPSFKLGRIKFYKYFGKDSKECPLIQSEDINKFNLDGCKFKKTFDQLIFEDIEELNETETKKIIKYNCEQLHPHYDFYLIQKETESMPTKLVIKLRPEYQFNIKEVEKVLNTVTGLDLSIINIIKKQFFDITSTPQVGLFNNIEFMKVAKEDFVWNDKFDGLRTLLIIHESKIYTYRQSEGAKEIYLQIDTPDSFILDTEYMEKNNKYIVFDVYLSHSKDVRTLTYRERMNSFDLVHRNIVKTENHELLTVKNPTIQDYEEAWSKLIEYSQIEKHNTDGIVIQLNKPYDTSTFGRNKEFYSFKLKPYFSNTVDFLVKKTDDIFRLYLIGSAQEMIRNMKYRPRFDKYSLNTFGYNSKDLDINKSYYILFDSPMIPNLWKYKPQPGDLNIKDGQIVEMRPVKNQYGIFWKPIRIRHDKINPNGYKIGLDTTNLIFSPVKFDKKYICKRTETPESIAYHNAAQMIRQYQIDYLKENYFKSNDRIKCCDLAGGHGAALKYLYDIGVTTLFTMDLDKEGLVIYQKRVRDLYSKTNRQAIKHLIANTSRTSNPTLIFNAFYGKFDIDNTPIRKELLRREEFKEHTLDFVNGQYFIQFLNDNKAKLTELAKLIRWMLNDDGICMLAFFEGQRIIDCEGKFKNVKIDYDRTDYGYEAKMYMPTRLEDNGIVVEPLIFESEILEAFKDDFNVLEINYSTNNTQLSMEVDKLNNYAADYLNCIKTIIFKVKKN
jgi:hypothetical protein